jgi:hypothetical protein
MRVYKAVFLFIALCVCASSFAQKGSSFIQVDGGVSLPLGSFGKVTNASALESLNGTKTDNSGYANPGGFFSVDGAWFFSKYFGIGGMFKYGTYDLKGVDSLSQGYEESFDVDTTRTSVTNYKMWTIMPGLYFNLPLAKKLSLTARALVGIAHAKTPAIAVGIEDGGIEDPPVVQYSVSKTAFASDLGVGIKYSIIKCVAISLRADYFYTKPDFTIANSARNNNAGREIYSYNQPLESVNFSLGLAYSFGHHHH